MSEEKGYTLIELLVVMVILGVVVGGLTTVFVSGSNAEVHLNRRFQAQQQARLALDRIRTDIHCATAAQAQTIGSYQGIKLDVTNCYSTSTTVAWCVVNVTTNPARYALYRSTTTSNTCQSGDTAKVKIADYVTTDVGVFTTGTISQYSLQTVAVDLKVNPTPSIARDGYELTDSIVARNSTRCYTVGGCTPTSVP